MEEKQKIGIECIAQNGNIKRLRNVKTNELCVTVWMMYVMCICMYHHKVIKRLVKYNFVFFHFTFIHVVFTFQLMYGIF